MCDNRCNIHFFVTQSTVEYFLMKRVREKGKFDIHEYRYLTYMKYCFVFFVYYFNDSFEDYLIF